MSHSFLLSFLPSFPFLLLVFLNINPTLSFTFTFSPYTGTDGILHPNSYRGLSTYYNTDNYEHNFIYNRIYWHDFEETKFVYDWYWTDVELDEARRAPNANNSMVAFRLMPFAGPGETEHECPAWLRAEMGDANGIFQGGVWFPDQSHPIYVSNALRAIRAFGVKYNNEPRVAHIDIGMVGFWGEWDCHVPCGLPTTEIAQQIIDVHYEAFPDKQLVQLATFDLDALRYSFGLGSGFRADLFGYWDPGWSHMVDCYPEQIGIFGEGWKTSPVHFEIAGVLQQLVDNGWDMETTWELGLEWHTTSLNLKDEPITPSVERSSEFEEFLDRMGYKITLSTGSIVMSGSNVQISTTWTNNGVAPPYLGYSVEYLIERVDGTGIVLESATKLGTNLLPDEPALVLDEEFSTGGSLSSGELETLRICVFYPVESPNRMKIRLDVDVDMDQDGCYSAALAGASAKVRTTIIAVSVSLSVVFALILAGIVIVVIVISIVCRNKRLRDSMQAGNSTTQRNVEMASPSRDYPKADETAKPSRGHQAGGGRGGWHPPPRTPPQFQGRRGGGPGQQRYRQPPGQFGRGGQSSWNQQ